MYLSPSDYLVNASGASSLGLTEADSVCETEQVEFCIRILMKNKTVLRFNTFGLKV